MGKAKFLFLLFFIVPFFADAQSFQWADNRLALLFDRMDYWCDYCYKDRTDRKLDSLRNASGRIYDFIESIIIHSPDALVAELPKAKAKGLNYATSADNKLRIYSWKAKKEGHGAQKYEYRDIGGFVTDKGRKYRDISNGTEGGICTGITTIKALDSSSMYMASYYALENGDKIEMMKVYAIEYNFLKEISVFKANDKRPKHLWCAYNIAANTNANLQPAIHFSDDKKKIFVPVTEKNNANKLVLTSKYLTYEFNGFEFILQDENAN